VANAVWFAVEWMPGLGFHPAQPGIATNTDCSMVALCLAASFALLGVTYRIAAGGTRRPAVASSAA